MDDDGLRENGRHKMDYYKGMHTQWNMMPQHQMKEQNSLPVNKKVLTIIAERDAAIHERNRALSEKKQALADLEGALEQRDRAICERNNALMERDNAIAALQYSNHNQFNCGIQRGAKRMDHHLNQPQTAAETHNNTREMNITEAFPISVITSEVGKSRPAKRAKGKNSASSRGARTPRKAKRVSEDLNRKVVSSGTKMKSEWDIQDVGLNLVSFDESTMPAPVCSCTGVPRQCYKWGNGGWQSSCCTLTLSVFPLPQMQNKRHARVGGRKMSGSVFTRLLTRVAAAGHDLCLPLDLKDFWARHGTNRYIIIK